MPNLILQLQLLLAALSALLPLIPDTLRAKAASFLDLAGRALSVTSSAASDLADIADKLSAVRAEVEAMAAAGRDVTADELDAVMARVNTASDAFRAALETAEASVQATA